MANAVGTIVNMDTETDNWDEDMSMEMLTDVGDGDVDEEVCLISWPLSLTDGVLIRYLLRLKHFLLYTIVKFRTTSTSWNTHAASAARLHALQA
jgi:hypothetical protein